MSPIDGVPGELHVLAARAAALADEVRTRAGEVRRHVRTGWTGPAAEAYAGAATAEAVRLERCADGLDDLVAALRGHARGADRRLEEVAELFGAARVALEVSAGLLPGQDGPR